MSVLTNIKSREKRIENCAVVERMKTERRSKD